jgi:putative acetyltransferase
VNDTVQVLIRTEAAGDEAGIREVTTAAFGGTVEADLIESLRAGGFVLLSLVAVARSRIAGHVLFSRMWIDTPAGSVPAAALAPMAVAPGSQRQGVGSRLIEQGLAALRARGERIVIVVGHPAYYPRFGFSSAQTAALDGPFSREAFMALELTPRALAGIAGRVRYPDAFGL